MSTPLFNRTRCARLVAAASFVALFSAVALAGSPARAEDRPTQIPYATPGTIPTLDSEVMARPTKRVLITNEGLSPSRVTLQPGERIAWHSYSGAATAIVFEREVAASMVCHSLVNFSIQEDELRSAEIHTGEVASFCELKPGTYRYRAIRTDPKAGGQLGAARRIEGWIVVNGPDRQDA